jgi:eukaryotic-like serine/threonine-protein kinase
VSDRGDSAASSAVTSSSDTSTLPRSIKTGTPLGRYLLTDVLGHGAMASVFRARDSQLGRDVALKVMGMTVAARGESAERFRREAHAVAALKHPGIVEIYDFVEATTEEPSYIVAELIEGVTLRQLLDQRKDRLLPEVAALVALPLAEALATAHARGIVHRDVKPDNVMLEHGQERSRVVITDFGVAHITGMETMTVTGALVGSPAYMSPEQARGHDVGPGADIWALGVLLYEMATGCLPFPGKDPFLVIAAISAGHFRRPSQIAATVGPCFERIVLRCLKQNPADRFPDAHQLAADLRALIQEAGLLPEQEHLHRFLGEQAKYDSELRPKIADAAVAEARRRARRGELARALAELGRATAYVPNHAGADALVKKLSAGRNLLRLGCAAAALAVMAAGGWLIWQRAHTRPASVATPPPAVASVAPPAPPENQPAPAPLPAAEAPPAPSVSSPPGAPPAAATPSGSRSKPGKRKHLGGDLDQPKIAAASQGPAESPPTIAEDPTPAPEPEPTPSAQPKPGSIHLFATGAICYPSLDDHPASVFMPRYPNVPAGRHTIYCTRNKGGQKELVGEIELPPGAKIERTVTQADGKLVLARPR